MPKQLQIRPIHPDDIPALYAIMSHPQVAESGLHLTTTEYSDTQENFQKSKPGVHRLVGILNGEVVAYGLLRQIQRARLHHTGEPGAWASAASSWSPSSTSPTTGWISSASNWKSTPTIPPPSTSTRNSALRLKGHTNFMRMETAVGPTATSWPEFANGKQILVNGYCHPFTINN